jgi:hypothetical protein
MFTANQFRTKAAEYSELLKAATLPAETREFRRLEQSYRTLAENEEWMADNFTKTNSPGAGEDWYGYVNATRVAQLTPVLHAKQLKLARELVPAGALIGVLINPDSPKAKLLLSDVQTAGPADPHPRRQQRRRSRGCICDHRRPARRRARCHERRVLQQAVRPDRRARGPPSRAHDLQRRKYAVWRRGSPRGLHMP